MSVLLTSASITDIEALLPEWLQKQRWFSKSIGEIGKARVLEHEYLNDSSPMLLWTLVEVDGGATYQVPLGLRRRSDIGPVLLGYNDALLGDVAIGSEGVVVYDALIDAELNKTLIAIITNGAEVVNNVRPAGIEQSNTSLVYDNRLILKVFRRLYEGPNPDLEVTRKLTEAGFAHVAPVVATWERHDHDLAVAQPFLLDGTDGWKLALASVRDWLGPAFTGGSATVGLVEPADIEEKTLDDPASSGGDFGSEAFRLGDMTAQLHVFLAEAFGTDDFDPATLVSSLGQHIEDVSKAERPAMQRIIDDVAGIAVGSAGKSCRVHGDYHLGQTLRATGGWYVFDFEGEPARPLSERTLPTSPLKDVAAMSRSFHYAIAAGLVDQVPADRFRFEQPANAWQDRNVGRFREGYSSVGAVKALLPADEVVAELLLKAFSLEKALYELHYERAYRPDWVAIPERAIRNILS